VCVCVCVCVCMCMCMIYQLCFVFAWLKKLCKIQYVFWSIYCIRNIDWFAEYKIVTLFYFQDLGHIILRTPLVKRED